MRGIIVHPCLKSNGVLNNIPHFYVVVMTYPCPNSDAGDIMQNSDLGSLIPNMKHRGSSSVHGDEIPWETLPYYYPHPPPKPPHSTNMV